ncbi:MAG: molybdopterin-dependent oxidoreductase [Armatimonadetes bacterium]|nr:molybdopterin-dependent oxidoreductase [Armatimonadota bacterium]
MSANDAQNTGLSRRDFLKLAGGLALSLGVGFAVTGPLSVAGSPNENASSLWGEITEEWVTTGCLRCPGGCGLRARLVNGLPVKLEGNPLHPVNRGGTCPRGQAGLQWFYHPDRLRTPMARSGRSGGKWTPIGWEEAATQLADALRPLREAGEPQALGIVAPAHPGLTGRLLERFARSFGTPNLVWDSDPTRLPVEWTQGLPEVPFYDLAGAHTVLCFGADFLDQAPSPLTAHRSYADFRSRRTGLPGKMIYFGPRFSVTASRADEWVPVQPEAFGAVALGIAHVLIKEGFVDQDFLDDQATGYEDYQDESGQKLPGFRDQVLQNAHPEDMARIAQVAPDVIYRAAREFTAQPSVAMYDRAALAGSNGGQNATFIHLLNALIGSIGRPGGVRFADTVPYPDLPDLPTDPVAAAGLAQPAVDGRGSVDGLVDALLQAKSAPLKCLLIYRTDPAYSLPEGKERVTSAFGKIPKVICFSSVLDETVEACADLVLPDLTDYESWRDVPAPSAFGYPCVGIARPLVEMAPDRRSPEDFLLNAASRLGGPVKAALPWVDFKSLVLESLDGMAKLSRGMVFSDKLPEIHLERLERSGTWYALHRDADDFREGVLERGGWWDPAPMDELWGRLFRTASRKLEFHPESVEVWKRTSFQAEREAPPAGYPLWLVPYPVMAVRRGSDSQLPWLREIYGHDSHSFWDTVVELNPDTAEQAGIPDRCHVVVESQAGRIEGRARHAQGVMPGLVCVSMGLGSQGTMTAGALAGNPLSLVQARVDPHTGIGPWHGQRVRIRVVG